jgi:hypothetical protein
VRDLCEDYNKSIGQRKSELSGVWSVSLFLRSIPALNAVILLIKFRLYDDAAIIIRTMFEIELQLGAINAEPGIATRLVQGTQTHREKRLKALIERRKALPSGITEQAMTEQIAEISAANIPAEIKKHCAMSDRSE